MATILEEVFGPNILVIQEAPKESEFVVDLDGICQRLTARQVRFGILHLCQAIVLVVCPYAFRDRAQIPPFRIRRATQWLNVEPPRKAAHQSINRITSPQSSQATDLVDAKTDDCRSRRRVRTRRASFTSHATETSCNREAFD